MRCLVLLAALLLGAEATMAAATLPADTTTRIGRGQLFADVPQPQQSGVIDWLWSSTTGSTNNCAPSPAGVQTGLYFSGDRFWAHLPYNAQYTLSWLQANHPDWIVYLADQQTPAWEFGDERGIETPMATWLPAYQGFLAQQLVAPLSYCNSLSADNVSIENNWGRDGTCSISFTTGNCTSNGGTFTSRYGGAYTTATAALTAGETTLPVASSVAFSRMGCPTVDCYVFVPGAGSGGTPGPQTLIAFISAIPDATHLTISSPIQVGVASGTPISVELTINPQIAADWDAEFAAIKALFPDTALWANEVYVDGQNALMNRAIGHADGVLSEAGFVFNCVWGYTGDKLIREVQFLNGLTQAIDINAYLSIGMPPCLATVPAANDWNLRMTMLAIYLMVKRANNDHTYLSESVNDYTTLQAGRFPELFLTTGAASGGMTQSGNVYYRDYPDLIAVLNPARDNANSYTVPNTLRSSYHTPDNCGGTIASGDTVHLAPMQGVILLPGATPAGKCGYSQKQIRQPR
jgi:hypothetical protein